MDIQQTTAPAPVKPPSAEKTEASKDARTGKVGAAAFSQLLQGLDGEAAVPRFSLEASAHQPGLAEGSLEGAALNGFESALDIGSLVGQTQRLDTVNADAAVQDGSFIWAQQEAGLGHVLAQTWGAQPHMAAGQHVTTVAAGVSTLPNAAVASGMDTLTWRGETSAEPASDGAAPVEQWVSEGLKSDPNAEGRVALQGAWKLEDAQAGLNPALQRLMGQVEQWVVSAGAQSKPAERLESSKGGTVAADGLSSGQGSGTRLTENAVKEAQQTQDAALESHNDAPVQDMRFWLQGKQQRAEVVLEKDGQPVRVQVAVNGNEAQVIFRADQVQTRDLLDASLAQLREMLEQQGLQLTGASVQAETRGDQPGSGDGQRSPWGAAPTQHAQVVVPLEGAMPARPQRSQGLDVYA